jgi:hypothetical protein
LVVGVPTCEWAQAAGHVLDMRLLQMMLPKGGTHLVILEGASLRELDYDRNKLVVTEVTNENRLKIGKGLHEEVAPRLTDALAALKKDSACCWSERATAPRTTSR